MVNKAAIGRLAFRQEGEWWMAYWAPDQHSMERAHLIGSMRIRLAVGEAKAAFMDAMQKAFANAVREVIGQTPSWSEPTSAPESERSGNA